MYIKTRTIKVKYLGPTNYKGSRVSLVDTYFGDRRYIDWDYSKGTGSLDQAVNWLEDHGFEVLTYSETKTHYFVNVRGFRDRLKEAV